MSNYDTIAASAGAQAVSETLSNLSPAATYHFRITAANQAGEADGMDETFTTAAACRGAERDRGWEAALAQTTTPNASTRLLPRARRLGRGPLVEQDGCADYELAIAGFASKRAATSVLAKAKANGFRSASVERT